jgi:hypothetical protein
MIELDEEELLDAIRKNREAREIRREAIEFLRARTARNVPSAVALFVLGLFVFAGHLWRAASIEGPVSELGQLLGVGVPILFLILGIGYLRSDPRDRLLLILAEESQSTCQSPSIRESDPPIDP